MRAGKFIEKFVGPKREQKICIRTHRKSIGAKPKDRSFYIRLTDNFMEISVEFEPVPSPSLALLPPPPTLLLL